MGVRDRREKVARLAGNTSNLQAQAKHFQKLASQQRAFFVQSERVAASGGQEAVDRHRAGEIFVVPAPENLGEDKIEANASRLAALGEQHPGLGQTYHTMAVKNEKKEDWEEAMRCHRKAVEILLASLGDVPPAVPAAKGVGEPIEVVCAELRGPLALVRRLRNMEMGTMIVC